MRPTIWQAAALLYLILPLAIFLLFFSNYLMAAAGLAFIGWALRRLLCDGVEQPLLSRPVIGCLFLLAFIIVGASGMLPPLWQSSDYEKHYVILHLLIDNPWPVVIDFGQGPEMLRYYLGWYLAPAGICKLFGPRAIDYVMTTWSALGLWLVFLLLAEALKAKSGFKKQWLAIPIALMFMFFSGADQLGTALTGKSMGPPNHFEWWATFYVFPSTMTSLVWAPQHGLATWIAAGLLLNAGSLARIIRHAGLFFFAVFFWSPFCAIGVVPFILITAGAKSFRRLFSISNVLSVATLAPPLLGYLLADAQAIPHDWIFNVPDWTMQNLIGFWLLEFGIFALLVMAIGTERRAMFGTAVLVLLIAPIARIGSANDFAMRVPAVAMAILAFVVIEIIMTRPWRTTFPLILVFMLGLGTPYAEISRCFRFATNQFRANTPEHLMKMDASNVIRAQYLAAYPNRFVR
ncbi:MAG: hypothetical protein WDO70_09040 [Alphaproteobacteria bacterium]